MPAAVRAARSFPAFFLLCYIVRARAIPIFSGERIGDPTGFHVLLVFRAVSTRTQINFLN
jgi:hypothetical protein